jgi:hypothetical protein
LHSRARMLARLTCSFVFTLSAVAGASPPEIALGAEQLQLEPRRDLLDDIDDKAAGRERLPWIRSAGFAQLTGGGHTGGDAGAGAAAALGGFGCDLAALSVQGRLRPFADDGDGPAVGELTYAACPFAVFFTLQWEGRRAAGIMPGIDARRSLWNRAYTESHDSVKLGFGPIWKDNGVRHTAFLVDFGHGETTQQDGAEIRTIKSLDIDLAMYRAVHPRGLSFDVLVLHVDAMKAGEEGDDRGGIASTFVPLRGRYETPQFFVAASAGLVATGGQVIASSSTEVNDVQVESWTETINGEGLPEITRAIGDIEAGITLDRWSATARAARTFFPTFDGNFAREGRVSGTVTYVAGRTRRTSISLAPFAARTRTWIRGEGTAIAPTAGATLHVGRELTNRLQLAQRTTTLRVDAIGQAGVSPYARAGLDRLPSSALGGQILVALSGSVKSLQPDVLR